MTAEELLREVVNAKYYHWDIEPILARALADERNRALEEAAKALTCPHEYPDPECRPYKCIGKLSNDVFHVLEGLKTDPAEGGR